MNVFFGVQYVAMDIATAMLLLIPRARGSPRRRDAKRETHRETYIVVVTC